MCKTAPGFAQNSGKRGSGGVIRGHIRPGFPGQIHGRSGRSGSQPHTRSRNSDQKTVSQISPIRPRIADPARPFSSSTGNRVHAHGKSFNLRLFFKTGKNTGRLNLQYSGPVRAALFRTGWNTWQGQKRPLLAFPGSPGRGRRDLFKGVWRRVRGAHRGARG